MTNATPFILISVFIVSLVSLAGAFLLSIRQDVLRVLLLYFVSFAVGALFANVFFHLLPEIAESSDDLRRAFSLVLLGIVVSFVIEKFIHWRHCHHLECEEHHPFMVSLSNPSPSAAADGLRTTGVKPAGMLVLIGDAAHNIIDGILIATTYLADVDLGIATTVAVILHEIPQEIGDFAVLIHSGLSRPKALAFNFLSALTAFLGAIAVLALHESIRDIVEILLPLTAGNFLYIAGSDLIPELHRETKTRTSLLQLLAMAAGILLLMAVR